MTNDTVKESQTWAVNERGEILVEMGTGTTTKVGNISSNMVPKSTVTDNVVLKFPNEVMTNKVYKATPVAAVNLIDTTRPRGGYGTLIADWSVGLVGAPSTTDAPFEPGYGAVVAQISSSSSQTTCTANNGSQSSGMLCAGFPAKMAPRANGQPSYICNLEFGTDATFANKMICAVTIVADGKKRFYVTPAQTAWGTGGTFTIGTTPFTHVQLRESASLATGSNRVVLAAGETVQIGPVYRDPTAKPFLGVRFDDNLLDQYVPRLSLSTPFVGLSGVTIPAGVPQSGLSLVKAFGLKATCYILTRHVGDTANGFLTVEQLRDLQDNEGWTIGFQSHSNPVARDNSGLRMLGPVGYNAMPIGQISAVNTGTATVTSSTHNITTTSGVAGNQGYPVNLLGSGFPTVVSGEPLNNVSVYWLKDVSTTTFKIFRNEVDSCLNTNTITFSAAGTPSSWGYRYRGSANDSSAIAADFATGQALMKEWGFTGWQHYAPNQGAWDIYTEAAILALKAAGNLKTVSGILGNNGITQNSYSPRVAIGKVTGAVGGNTNTGQGTSLAEWQNLPTSIDTHAAGVDASAAIKLFCKDVIARGGIAHNYHHHHSVEDSMRNEIVYMDMIKFYNDQQAVSTGNVEMLYDSLVLSGAE